MLCFNTHEWVILVGHSWVIKVTHEWVLNAPYEQGIICRTVQHNSRNLSPEFELQDLSLLA